MRNAAQDLTIAWINFAHPKLAEFARASYKTDGRGVIRVEFPPMPETVFMAGSTMMTYHPLEETRGFVGDLPPHEDAEVLVRMIETYDPSTQAVVIAHITGAHAISMKMKLDPPIVSDEAAGVH